MKVHISCLVDCDPKFVLQAYNWLISVKASGTSATPFICAVDGALSEAQVRTFQQIGANVVSAKRFGDGRAAYCNKISQLFIDEVLQCDWLILSDADIGFVAAPEQMINGAPLRAKPVDLPSPEAPVLEEWLGAIGMPWFGDADATFAHDRIRPKTMVTAVKTVLKRQLLRGDTDKMRRKTLAHNYNGGLYVIRREEVEVLRKAWSDYALKLLAAAPADAKWAIHADQVGFACAVNELGSEVSELESGWNFPTHFAAKKYSSLAKSTRLYGLHYHNRMDNHGLPEKVGVPWIDSSITALRGTISVGRRELFDNEIFWNYRYKYFPELGSGLGSRAAALTKKKSLTAPAFNEMNGSSVLDVGCGDLEFVRNEAFGDYLGLDLSEQAIATAKKKRPEWSFRHGRIDTVEDASFDFALCMDVLIHQPNGASAMALVDDLIRVVRKGIVVSIHAEQQTDSGISFNTFALRTYLQEHPDTHAIVSLGQFRDAEIFAVSKIDGVFEDI